MFSKVDYQELKQRKRMSTLVGTLDSSFWKSGFMFPTPFPPLFQLNTSTPLEIEGYLYKRGKGGTLKLRLWNRRWFFLKVTPLFTAECAPQRDHDT